MDEQPVGQGLALTVHAEQVVRTLAESGQAECRVQAREKHGAVAVAPVGPIGPALPVSPVAPCGPTGPCGPRGPRSSGPFGPTGPTGPCGPAGPTAPAGPVSDSSQLAKNVFGPAHDPSYMSTVTPTASLLMLPR